MIRQLSGLLVSVLLALHVQAADRITEAQIQEVIDATDVAAQERDTEGIGKYLSENFEKIIEFPHDKWMARIKLDKKQYLVLIDEGWATAEAYDYQRGPTVIHLMPDGLNGQSYSTVTENVIQDGRKMTSRYREHALYTIENGMTVITQISGHTLVGDTTPASGQ